MILIFLVLLAVLLAVLALAFGQPWLYAAAAVPLLGALGLLGSHLWAAFRRRQETDVRPTDPPGDKTLEDLGIMDVRPQEREGGDNGASSSDVGTARPASSEGREDGRGGEPAPSSPEASMTASSGAAAQTARERERETSTPAASNAQPVLAPFLESLRAATGAHTVTLLVQEDVVLEYRIEAIASARDAVRHSGTFETRSPLLTATMSRRAVTVRRLEGEDELADLGYYERPPALEQVALAPVAEPGSSSTVFLLVDATTEGDLETSRARTLIEHFADTIALLRDPGESVPKHEALPTDGEAQESASEEVGEERSDQPRPRSEIIAEEMEAADEAGDPFALVLVHLNRAESIARRGEEAVETAERLLKTRLEHFAPGQRVERFGELTYGLFPHQGLEAVEVWAADLQAAMDEETGELEGGVSVGVAVRDDRHDASALRTDATEALREAYETGTCTIVA